MKRALLSLLAGFLTTAAVQAQDLQITNISGCDLSVKAYYGTTPCIPLGSIVTSVPNGTTTSPIYLTAPVGNFLYAEIFDCGGVIGTVGDPAVGCAPASATPSIVTSCGPGGCLSGHIFDALATSGCTLCPTGGWVLELY